MALGRTPEAGTLVIAALLLLVLAFAGYWITEYADPRQAGAPWALVSWFLAGATLIIVVALVVYLVRTSGSRGP
jgi:uncharacterized membrane protein YidH (DUF202 family)